MSTRVGERQLESVSGSVNAWRKVLRQSAPSSACVRTHLPETLMASRLRTAGSSTPSVSNHGSPIVVFAMDFGPCHFPCSTGVIVDSHLDETLWRMRSTTGSEGMISKSAKFESRSLLELATSPQLVWHCDFELEVHKATGEELLT
ncbi:hypothetical protein CC1G_08411 [Coprinopsis cinerea okayama7|uniref:Uncharacterized protein n=1 Tax=Coprinopsis cinerea (strain Okayama-7 / 130 / ATCC MYA-4618 / FGSC 9003) TaxID=240176 RepID=A8NAP2_COPC7|nr:hypothetical protein CC1G_08411 [Coprinopsis cinerea okayama7\|eukprot:XP_001831894.1 hypothetical protein CC1G_08411 [Coprinopsis cinerea okayama7\